MYNWSTLNERVFKHFNLQLSKEDISAVAGAQPLVIEAFLKLLKSKLEKCPSSAARKCETDKADEGKTYAQPGMYIHTENSSCACRSSSADRTSSLASHKAAAQLSDSETQTLASQENDSNGVVATPAPNTAQIRELQETIEVLEAKVFRLEQLMKLKGGKTGRLKRL
ncbi:sperm flagellar protein 1-like [Selaginella moellendorffii]|uniref:sperm flagellar protein 1-like n=1 Tax=Selaginella moellendorffii TaxID=88036 RepID=UPI000D1C60CC|nr:sperm flagellar protein 1-like [Selaginella moellendorffii]|eukprot:XP_024536108.1 sperm flagellar protein 1-like [Selaginella moellendorffii]